MIFFKKGRLNKPAFTITAFLLSAISAFALPISVANAAPWDNRFFSDSLSNSYFDNARYFTPEYLGYTSNNSVIDGGVHSNSVDEFVGFLIGKNRGANSSVSEKRDVAGAAFIVQTLLGRNGDEANNNGGRSISDADFTNLKGRLNAATINWNTTVCTNGINTMAAYGSGNADVLRDPDAYYDNKCEDGIQFVDKQGHVYSIFHRCANPVGDNSGLADVPVDYNLTPQTTTGGSNSAVVEAGTKIPDITYGVGKSGGAPTSKSTNWQLARCVYTPGYSPTDNYVNAAPDNTSNTVTTYTARGGSCSQVASGNTTFSANPTTIGTLTTESTGAAAVGAHICYILGVNPPTDFAAANAWRHSTPVCMLIGKKPKAQILGGDLNVGKVFGGGSTTSNVYSYRTTPASGTATFGSWIEYGIFATGTIKGTGSGAVYAGTGLQNASGTNECDISLLSFTNAGTKQCGNGTVIGNYTSGQGIPDVAANFPGAGVSIIAASVSPNSLLAAAGTYMGSTAAGTGLTLTKSDLQAGKTVILKVDGTVTIAGDQTNNPNNGGAGYTGISQLPQLVIIADKIIINSGVVNVDAWLIANGTNGIIETCDTGASSYDLVGAQRLTGSTCNKQLTVNGPVMAKHLWLRRTAGADAGSSGSPGEIFNLRADAFLWTKSRSNSNGRVQTVYTTELPPRL